MILVESRVSSAAAWSSRLAWFAAVLFAVSVAGHYFALLEILPFLWTLALVCAIAVMALALAVAGLRRIWNRGERGARRAVIGAIVAMAVLSPYFYWAFCLYSDPQLHDISTDTSNPPLLIAASRQAEPGMNEESAARQAEYYPEIAGRRYNIPFERARDIVEALAAARGWCPAAGPGGDTLNEDDAMAVTLEFLAFSPILGLPADVAIRLTEEDASTYVDMRSVTRHGRCDFGANARNIVDFLARLDAEVAAQIATTVPGAHQ